MLAVLPGQTQASKSERAHEVPCSTLDTQNGHAFDFLYLQTVRSPEDEVEVRTPTHSRRDRRHLRELRLEDFLKANGFRDVNEPRQGGCFSFKET